jgi:hypothetical protein
MLEKVTLKFEDRAHVIPVSDLDVAAQATDQEVKTAVERHLDLGEGALAEFVVWPDEVHEDRPTVSVLNILPDPVHGNSA